MATNKKTAQRPARVASPKPASQKLQMAPAAPSGYTIRLPRRFWQHGYPAFRLHERGVHRVRLPSAWRLTVQASKLLWNHRRLFIGLTIMYGLLNLVLVRGLASGTNVSGLKAEFDQTFKGNFGQVAASVTVFAELVGSAGNGSSNTAGAYQVFLVLLASLAIIWALRQTQAGVVIRIRDAYYRGMYPLVPFILVLGIVSLQLLPLVIGAGVYSLVVSSGIAVLAVEKICWAVLAILLALLSLYMVSSSLFALYIVTLPDMTPLKALRSARGLVRYRRWTVLRKVLFLPVVLLLLAAIIMVPIIILLTPLAEWVFFVLTMFALAAVHSYMYSLYRELLYE